MTVYKGIGEHTSSQSPAMNYDKSSISLRLNMGYVDIRGGAIFGRQGHNLNKLGRGSQDDATNIISRLLA